MESSDLSYEVAFEQLEETVARLEDGGLSIEELVALFERGMALVQTCDARLDAAELRVAQLVPAPDGSATVAPFED